MTIIQKTPVDIDLSTVPGDLVELGYVPHYDGAGNLVPGQYEHAKTGAVLRRAVDNPLSGTTNWHMDP